MKQALRSMVERIDFFTSFGHGDGGEARRRLGLTTKGPTLLVTDLAVWKPDPKTREFVVQSLHPGTTRQMVADSCGWTARFAANLGETPPPTPLELETLRDLQARTRRAHQA
jgi:glutaconate CoA-transferase subunit B